MYLLESTGKEGYERYHDARTTTRILLQIRKNIHIPPIYSITYILMLYIESDTSRYPLELFLITSVINVHSKRCAGLVKASRTD